jgi:hypothetical protein
MKAISEHRFPVHAEVEDADALKQTDPWEYFVHQQHAFVWKFQILGILQQNPEFWLFRESMLLANPNSGSQSGEV